MPIVFRILNTSQLIVASLRGRVTEHDAVAAIREVAVDPAFRFDMDRLVFLHADLDMSETMLADMFSIKKEIIQQYFGGNAPPVNAPPVYKMAIVTKPSSNELTFRLFQAVMKTNKPAIAAVETFHSPDKALHWLDRSNMPQHVIAPELDAFLSMN